MGRRIPDLSGSRPDLRAGGLQPGTHDGTHPTGGVRRGLHQVVEANFQLVTDELSARPGGP